MPVPKRRHSSSRRDRARAHKSLTDPLGATCPKCGEVKLSHRICPSCGFYKDRPYVVKVTKD